MRRPSGDELLVRRTARGIGLQAGALVGGAMLLLVVLVTLVVVRGQQQASDRLLRSTAATADDVGDPPASSWILFDAAGQVSTTGGFPDDIGSALADLRRHPVGRPVLTAMSSPDGEPYRVATQQRRDQVVQVVLDLRPQRQDRDRLFAVMSGAAALALLLSAGLGALLGRRAVRPLAHALALQRTFVADASHELRTPLTLLSTRVQLLDRQLHAGLGPQVRKDSRHVVSDVHRLVEVVDDLLVAADPRRDEHHEAIDVATLLHDVAGSAAPYAAQTGVTLSTQVPEHDHPLITRGSAPALRRAVLALVDNAVDHTAEGGSVQIRGARQGRQVVIAVSDTGGSATAGSRVSVMAGGRRAARPHYGLGLALTRDVADRHSGYLRRAPSIDGTTFELVLPSLRP